MPSNLVLETLKHAWVALQPTQAPVAVMGGIAMAAWEHARATRDVDLLLGIANMSVDDLLSLLKRVGFRPKRQPPVRMLGNMRLIQLLYEPPGAFMDLQVDLLLADSEYHRTALSRRVSTNLPDLDLEVSVLTCEDLILHKLLAQRAVDRADCVALLTANRATLDRAYLLRWSTQLNLAAELSTVWEAAFPGKTLSAG